MPARTTETWSHGAVMLDKEHTRFALWAPDAKQVTLLLYPLQAGQQDTAPLSVPMLAQEHGWFVVETASRAGSTYRYAIDNDLEVPDPASRAQESDVHSPSRVVDPQAYTWQHPHWQGRPWHEAVIYELHIGTLGGYEAVERHLARLAGLGITAIELMPIAEFPGARNWGYDGVLPYAPEASYGTPEQLKHLIDTAHGHGLMVILDVVYNHFGPDGNYLGAYAKEFFRDDKHTPWGVAIDFRRPEVRSYFIDNALMWINEYRFDGLRFDAVHAIESPDFLGEMAKRIRGSVAEGRHVYLTLENEHNQASLMQQGYDAQWNDDGHNALHVLLTGETEAYYEDYAQDTTGKLARCLSEGFVYQGHVNRHGEQRGEPSGHLPPTAFVLFLQNHDQIGNRAFGERLSQLCSEPALRAATTLLLLSPMIPMVFMGDEWASDEPFLFFTDHHGELAEAVRKGRREEFKAFAAFQDATQRAQIPDPNHSDTFHASRPHFEELDFQQDGPWVQLYRQLLALRRDEIVPRLPGSMAEGCTVLAEGVVSARWRMGDGSLLRIDLNLSSDAVLVDPVAAEHLLFDSRPAAQATPTDGSLGALTAQVSMTPGHGDRT
ncbi:malto-oligosyltrehalose trehalohydrolase [Pseudomonas sp. dw_358]|uniref:malto-oligosyltrehalose trehalohydrolase n=1 Tax=Pseudomonas sp. dw_358 TaxID=2720083 RepID=UPI001BD6A5F3|nr:malto-oligosyltrehalose trehalohydrolase [Pseudomonas sp. dw_358]